MRIEMVSWILDKIDDLIVWIGVTACGFLGHDYTRSRDGHVYCEHCHHVFKEKD